MNRESEIMDGGSQNIELLVKYFPGLTVRQRERFAALGALYEEWNARINVISRRDMASGGFYVRHVLHSLAIARVCGFAAGARVLDIGTGGGFPAIPLAIMFPEAHFTAVDSIGKKIRVVEEVARGVGLENIVAVNGRVEQVAGRFDYVVSRAVAPTATLLGWTWSKIERGEAGTLPNGALFLKGGDLAAEFAEAKEKFGSAERQIIEYNIAGMFDEEFFETKKVIYIKK
jgi:16S rRNA (guanine527-N7)-methyltransferase